jgi:hypothetical protein
MEKCKEKEKNSKKTTMFQGCPVFPVCKALLPQKCARPGFGDVHTGIQPAHPRAGPPWLGCSFLCWVHSEIFMTFRGCSFTQKVLFIERFCQVGWADFEP